jgi:hypothetical protein
MCVCRWRRLAGLIIIVALAPLAACGCGKGTGTVSGKVFYKDKPLKGGSVVFLKADGQSEWAQISEDGSYMFPKPIPTGTVKVGVDNTALRPPLARPGMTPAKPHKYSPPPGEKNPNEQPDPEEMYKRYTPIPDKYVDPKESGKTYDVKSGAQEYDIKLD